MRVFFPAILENDKEIIRLETGAVPRRRGGRGDGNPGLERVSYRLKGVTCEGYGETLSRVSGGIPGARWGLSQIFEKGSVASPYHDLSPTEPDGLRR